MDNDIIIGDIETNLKVIRRNIGETLQLMQRLNDSTSNTDAYKDLISAQRLISDLHDYFKTQLM